MISVSVYDFFVFIEFCSSSEPSFDSGSLVVVIELPPLTTSSVVVLETSLVIRVFVLAIDAFLSGVFNLLMIKTNANSIIVAITNDNETRR